MKKFLFVFIFLFFSHTLYAYQAAVVSAHPEATKVGIHILKEGGSAADAAIATAFALAVVEPYYSGIGGGGFLLYYEAKTQSFYFVDYREAAPLQARRSFFKKDPDKIKKGINSVAVPGFILGMETIHKKWRKVSWPKLIEPSIKLAKRGVPLRGRLSAMIEHAKEKLESNEAAQEIFVKPYTSFLGGDVKQKDLANTLTELQTGGADYFYKGELAKKIAQYFRDNKGLMRLWDLKNYHVYFRKPYQFRYRDYEITSAPIPSSGGRGLDILFRRSIIYQLEQQPSKSQRAYELMLKAMKSYFEFRDLAMGDSLSNVISHTTHLSVIDDEGNMAAMTNSLNYAFGSGLVVPGTGIVLNNEMADFEADKWTANRVRAKRRPLSSMSPTIIFKNKKPNLIIGATGGVTIPQNLFQILFGHWVWKQPLKKAMKQPKFYYLPKDGEVLVEEGLAKKTKKMLGEKATLKTRPFVGNVQALGIKNHKKTIVYPDPRGEGEGKVLH